MKLFGKKHLQLFQLKHPSSRLVLSDWESSIEKGSWKHFVELKASFSSADYVQGFIVFNIKGNDYRLIAVVVFVKQQLIIKHIFTHSEYDKWSKSLKSQKRNRR